MNAKMKSLAVLLLLAISVCLINCGGGGGGGSSTPPPSTYEIITPSPLDDGFVSLAYEKTLGGSNPQPGSWQISSGSLPPGLSLTSTFTAGLIKGVPTAEGTYSFRVTVTWMGTSATKDFTITIKPGVAITPAPLPDASTGIRYEQTLSATKVSSSAKWEALGGIASIGLSLTGSGTTAVLAGTPHELGTFPFTVHITDGNDNWFKDLSITVKKGAFTIVTTSLPDAEISRSYGEWLRAVNQINPPVWSTTGGALPPGMVLLSEGWLGGKPTQEGTFNFTVKAVDGQQSATQDLTLKVLLKPLVITTTSLSDGNTASYYTGFIFASGGTGTRQWSVVSGSLPSGLTGVPYPDYLQVNGLPTTAGTYSFRVKVVDGTQTATADLSIKVTAAPLAIDTVSIFDAVKDNQYNMTVSIEGGSGTKAYTITNGTLPHGLTFDASKVAISGVPDTVGTYPFTFTVSDDTGSVSRDYVIHVSDKLVLLTTSIPHMKVNEPYSYQIEAIGGLKPYRFDVWPLPKGVVLTSDGKLEGTPGLPYSSTLYVNVYDAANPMQLASANFLLVVEGPMEILNTTLPPAIINQPYTAAPLQVAGGAAPYSWSVASGSLPTGLVLDAGSGKISGTPTGPATEATFTIQVVDSSATQQKAVRDFNLPVRVSPGRNDSIASATFLYTNGYAVVNGSISPFADPADTSNPDTDYYRLTADAGNTVQISIVPGNASAGIRSSFVPVLEIVDASGVRLQTCSSVTEYTTNHSCLIDGSDTDQIGQPMHLLVPGNAKTVFYVRVLDFFGDARPDYTYQLTIYGAD